MEFREVKEKPMAYEPKLVEDKWYAEWMNKGYFHPTPGKGKPYCITIPPPNITGSLHIGHALNNAILDTMTRWHRMMGDNTLCLPGTDHAGIATQNVVERNLASEGLSRHDLGREKFIEKCWEWRKEYGDRIYQQFQKLGLSYDWERARFTMDESYVDAIYEEFLQWWDRGLIYRGARVVNWCPRCRSAISDIEVNSEERSGNLYYFQYPFTDGSGAITIATTRPETMLGDTAVAVHPNDERYRHWIGKRLHLPLTDREIPLIADEFVKMDFGTGAVKVTPAHDLDDFETGQRHHLEQIVVIGEDGCMTEAAGAAYAGLDRFECRNRVIADLEKAGLLVKIENYALKAPLCDRCKTILEPLLSEQWFVKMKPLAKRAIEVVEEDRIRIIPERYKRIYLDWMNNIRDWCISRQLWWGHRIPVWWTEDGRYVAARNEQEAAAKLGVTDQTLRQDEDVLDTWFSSALWPHATLGWPRKTEELAFWYPTDLLSTAQEILFLWVARMIMTGMDFLDEIPFKDVYIHATVLDEKGDRMSKSKGNGVDPLEMIDKYGADALRFSLLQQAGMNQDIKFSEDRVRIAGQFCNKLWNASRFVLMNLDPHVKENGVGFLAMLDDKESLLVQDRWILSRLNRTLEDVNLNLASYNMDDAMRSIHSFLWDDFCDWYVELSKPRLRSSGEDKDRVCAVLTHTLDTILRMLHPMTPFITEEIWSELMRTLERKKEHGSIMFAPYPLANPELFDDNAEKQIEVLIETIRSIRNLRAEIGIAPSAKVKAAIVPANRFAALALTDHADFLQMLSRCEDVHFRDSTPQKDGKWIGATGNHAEIFIEIRDAMDMEKELTRIERELEALSKDQAKIEAKLSNAQFLEKAPEHIVNQEKERLTALLEKKQKLTSRWGLLTK